MEIDYTALMEVFLAEAEERVAAMETGLLTLEHRPEDDEALAEVFRAAHTLKGDAATLGLSALADFSHRLEDLLDLLRAGTIQATGSLISLLLQAVDVLRELIADGGEGRDEMKSAHLEFLGRLAAEVERQSEEGDPGSAGAAAAEPQAAAGWGARSQTLRVAVERLDQLLTLAGETIVARGRLAQMLEDRSITREQILEEVVDSERLHMDLQELVMKLRMVPVGPTFQQFARPVRDLSRSLGKHVRFEIEGGDVEVDNSVVQLLKDPLSHMIRNAIDHGIEAPDVRRQRGKNPMGKIVLGARHEASNVLIRVSDDGAGIDRRRILERAREIGLVAADERPAAERLFQLIFTPGFSTAEEVTDLSGRGVGMDVVRNTIQALRGSIDVESELGIGTTVQVRLPLTLAIVEGLLVRVEDETYVLPIDTVVETVDLPEEARGSEAPRGVVNLRGRSLPYVRLRNLFQVGGKCARRENLVVVQHGSGVASLVVDQVSGRSQTVIKPLSKLFRNLPGISGSAILGNGSVALILDVPALLQREVEKALAS